jgi:hypothetical protein
VTSGKVHSNSQSTFSWPLKLSYNYVVGASSATQKTSVVQTKSESGTQGAKGNPDAWLLLNTVQSSDTLTFTASGYSPSNGKSQQRYKSLGLQGSCYDKLIKSADYMVKSIIAGC